MRKHLSLVTFIFLSCLLACSKKEENEVTPDPKPIANFTIVVDENGDVNLTNTSENANSYEWDFGIDNGSVSGAQPNFHYEKSGQYTVTLKATGPGGTDSSSQQVTVTIIQKDILGIDQRVEKVLNTYNFPGATLAISKGGKLVYAKGYGMADKEAGTAVNTESRFRIGSQSKTICATAIMKLVEKGKLNLDDLVFGEGALLGTSYGNSSNYSENLKKITVHHLLSHSAGGWGTYDNQGDIMGQVVNSANSEFLSHIISSYPLVTSPGTRHSYANFGYFVLARIVEVSSGKNYLNYLNEELFNEIGLKNTIELSGPKLQDRKENEVRYYPQNVGDDFYTYANLNYERRDGPGGLLMSSTDLLRIINSIDGFADFPDVLNSASITRLSQPNNLTNHLNYAYGLVNNNGWWNHAGSIPSQYGIWLRSPGGINVTLNFNSRIDMRDTSLASAFNADVNAILAFSANNPDVYQKIDQF